MQRLAGRILFLLILSPLAGCSTAINCPPANKPQGVALIDHGRHASLIVSQGANQMTRYGYGDWNYYALKREGILSGARALFWPTPAALGKKDLTGPLSEENIRRKLFVSVENIYFFKAESAKVEKLEKHLERIFRENRELLHYNKYYDLNFVPYPDNYWALNNSSQKIAAWVEQIGCEARGTSIFSIWSN